MAEDSFFPSTPQGFVDFLERCADLAPTLRITSLTPQQAVEAAIRLIREMYVREMLPAAPSPGDFIEREPRLAAGPPESGGTHGS